MLSPDVIELLENWQFRSACTRYNERHDDVPDADTLANEYLLGALSQVFRNSGVFPGAMGVIVAAAVSTLLPPDDE